MDKLRLSLISMYGLRRFTSLILSTAVLPLSLSIVCLPVSAAHKKEKTEKAAPEAEQVYHQVWDLIKTKYYDATCGGQDWSRWEHKYDGLLENDEDEQKAIDTMLASLGERFTRYLNKAAFGEETTQIAGHMYGIGVQIQPNKAGRIEVVAPLEGSPAANAGLMPGDIIDEIDGKQTNGFSVQQASNLIKGPENTVVTLKLLRHDEPKVITVTRGEIKLKSVQTVKMLNSGIGYIRLSTFMSATAGQEVQDALVALTPARGVILDLRDNPGGLVTNAIDVCSLFIRAGVMLSTVDRDNHSFDTRVSGKLISTQPLVVLMNGGTASAGEITSGALRDTGRADLVGTKHSFGKGLVQSVTKLLDGSGVNVTIARYLTPNGSDIHKVGIVPDYIVDLDNKDLLVNQLGPWWYYKGKDGGQPDPVGAKDIQLAKAEEVMEAKLKADSRPYELKLETPFSNSTENMLK